MKRFERGDRVRIYGNSQLGSSGFLKGAKGTVENECYKFDVNGAVNVLTGGRIYTFHANQLVKLKKKQAPSKTFIDKPGLARIKASGGQTMVMVYHGPKPPGFADTWEEIKE